MGFFKKKIKNRNSKLKKSSLLLLGVGFLTISGCNSSKKEDLGTFNDPKLALIETQKVLFQLSKNVNMGIESVHTIKEYEKTKNKIFNLDLK